MTSSEKGGLRAPFFLLGSVFWAAHCSVGSAHFRLGARQHVRAPRARISYHPCRVQHGELRTVQRHDAGRSPMLHFLGHLSLASHAGGDRGTWALCSLGRDRRADRRPPLRAAWLERLVDGNRRTLHLARKRGPVPLRQSSSPPAPPPTPLPFRPRPPPQH